MHSYDPVIAKEDKTAVFNEYKAKHDLLQHAAPTSGPVRKTRRHDAQLREVLASTSISAPIAVTPLKRKAKQQQKANKVDDIYAILATAKGGGVKGGVKGKGKEKAEEGQASGMDTAPPAPRLRETLPSGTRSATSHTESISAPGPRFDHKRPVPEVVIQTRPDRKPVENERVIKVFRPGRDKVAFAPATNAMESESISSGVGRRSERFKEPPLKKIKLTPHSPHKHSVATDIPLGDSSASPASAPNILRPVITIKKIKLICRRPTQYSHPRQRPPPSKYGSSVQRYLTSYINIDEEDVEASALEERAKEEAEIWERVELFRQQGRYIPGTDVLFGTDPDEITYVSPTRTTEDIWDQVVKDVIQKVKSRPRKPLSRQITSQIANKVQSHFDLQENKRNKAAQMEYRRLQLLAKSTVKVVVAEWKKAVFHIREKERLAQEEEERRIRGEHLDAILHQSDHILATQHGNLYRSRSGSHEDMDDEEDTTDDEDEGAGEEDEEVEEGEGEDEDVESLKDRSESTTAHHEDDDEEEEASSMVLDMSREASVGTRSSTPTTNIEDDEPDTTTHLLLGDSFNAEAQSIGDDTMMPDAFASEKSSIKGSAEPFVADSCVEAGSQHRYVTKKAVSPPAEAHLSPASPLQMPFEEPDTSDPPHIGPQVNDSQTQGVDDVKETPDFAENEDTAVEHVAVSEEADEDTNTCALEDKSTGQADSDDESDVEAPDADEAEESSDSISEYLRPYAVAPVEWDPSAKVTAPILLRGVLRPYQQAGLEWLASMHVNRLNGILADEMGLGKTIQTIALLAHLACDRGIWGPHLIIVPTSVILNWEMEFKKFLPGFRVLSYHGTTKRRKELRQGWNDKHSFNVCITSYTLASRDAHIFKRKAWYYMILDEAHMIKNFKSQRWNILLMFRSYRRLLLTGTPLQNNLTELWSLLQFLMSGANFANLKEFGEWFANPLEKAIEAGTVLDDDTMQRVNKLHTVLRPYLLRRLKRDVEKELPSKFEHLMLCPLSKRQRFLYDEFMARAQTRDALQSGVYQKIANILMQLRKVCNHPDLFEVRQIVTSFSMSKSAIADFEIKELLVRRRLLAEEDSDQLNLDFLGLRFIDRQNVPLLAAVSTRYLDATSKLPHYQEMPGEPPPQDTRTIEGFRRFTAYQQRCNTISRWSHVAYLNKLRCSYMPIYSTECLSVVSRMAHPILPFSEVDTRQSYLDDVCAINRAVKSHRTRAEELKPIIERFAFVTPTAVSSDLARFALSGHEDTLLQQDLTFDDVLHQAAVKLQIAFPDPSLLQYDCGKLQKLAELLREKKMGGHRVLIFTQMTRILDILEIFLNFHGYLYLRLDGATKIEDRQYITERFNADARIFCFISSSRSGGVGINLTGADTVVFYDSDFNPQMDRQCEDRAHRIGQIRDVHIYRFVSQYTVEEAMLRKANQKRSLDDLVIQKGEFDWRSLFNDESALAKALVEYEDEEDRNAAKVAAQEETSLVGADEVDFGADNVAAGSRNRRGDRDEDVSLADGDDFDMQGSVADEAMEQEDEDGGTVVDYMLAFVQEDYEFFKEWRL
ncbi:hypothetical protein CVT24_004265 [Panaeolus cyanescens]|uniref:Helicase SWR1 n=1 Tax=Panaeolus cyanescens TaxID=181874 RepID=A0A409VA90_9AGAR|nr:hypothetical protein CVT24_004265 [Panaeolus cyanescens]